MIERTKDEESKRFQIHNINFDFDVLLRIKESMVDLSSNCIEIALKVYMVMEFNFGPMHIFISM